MSDTRFDSPVQKAPKSTVALWKCTKCNSFISIESLRAVFITACPVCQGTPLELCGRFENIPVPATDDDNESDDCCESDLVN